MGLGTKTQPPLIGVDISSTAVKLLQLARTGDRYRVEHYAVEPLPPNAVLEKNLVEVEAVGEAIRRAVARSGSRVKFAAAAVSGSSVITKVITMPAELDEDEMESQIELEAVSYTHLDVYKRQAYTSIWRSCGAACMGTCLAASTSARLANPSSAMRGKM